LCAARFTAPKAVRLIAAPQRANISHIPEGNMLALALVSASRLLAVCEPARKRGGSRDSKARSALFVQPRPEREAWLFR